jgi:hypothetical protein
LKPPLSRVLRKRQKCGVDAAAKHARQHNVNFIDSPALLPNADESVINLQGLADEEDVERIRIPYIRNLPAMRDVLMSHLTTQKFAERVPPRSMGRGGS